MTLTKTCLADLKAVGDSGEFTAIVSVYGNVDKGGDVVMAGAFADSLKAWADSGDPIPVIWSHQWSNLDAHIGIVTEAKELAPGDALLPPDLVDFGGLWVRCQLDDDGAKASKVRSLLRGRRVKQFSFAYDVLEAAWAERDGCQVYELRKLALHEVGPTLLGMNPATDLLSAKTDTDVVAALKTARDLIDTALATSGEVAVVEPVKTMEPAGHPSTVDQSATRRPRLAFAGLALLDA